MTKFRFHLNTEQNTAWLNQMAADGQGFINYMVGFYTFEPCNPGEYQYKIDDSDAFFSVSTSYKDTQKDAGIEILQCFGSKVYLRRKTSDIPFPEYPNTDSLLEHYIKVRDLFKIASLLEIICFVLELYVAITEFSAGFLLTLGIGLVLIVCMQAAINANKVIVKLRQRKGERLKGNEDKMNKVSLILPLGILLNSVPFAIQYLGGDPLYSGIIQLIAFLVLAVGIIKTRHIWGR